jgi:ferredoxin--NADP+ reductase
MKIEDMELEPRYTASLMANEPLTAPGAADEVRELVLMVDEGGFRFDIGQSIAVLVAGPHDFGQQHHVRLYSISSTPSAQHQKAEITICVRRCNYVDPFSGERYEGVASNYLCDLPVGSRLTIAGPIGMPFKLPENPESNLLMMGLGTGIAPFRALIRHIYTERGGWRGKIRLFYGARSGLEMAYMNDRRNEFARYLDEKTFAAVEVLSPRPARNEPAAFERAIRLHKAEVWSLILDPNTYVYLAGLESLRNMLETALAELAGSTDEWARIKASIVADDRWAELLY